MTPACIVFVGSRVPTREWLEQYAKPLIIRRDKVRAALQWLSDHNPLYENVTVNNNAINELPEHGVLPFPMETVPFNEGIEATTSRYDMNGNENNTEAVTPKKLSLTLWW